MNGNFSDIANTTCIENDASHTNFAIKVNGVKVEIAIFNFRNRLFISITQFNTLGTLVRVHRNFLTVGEEREISYDIKTLFGDDQLNYHVAARCLAEYIDVNKPILLSIGLRDLSSPTLQSLRKAILENKIW